MTTVSIFVSHNHNDNAFCQSLVDALQKAGADVWYDERNLGPEELRKTIERELRRRLIFIVVLSPEALASEWVYDECNWAYSLYKRDSERSRIILPIVARSIKEDDIWLFLAVFKRIEGSGCTGLPQHEAIQHALSLLALSSPAHADSTYPIGAFTIDDLLERGTALLAQKRHQEALTIFETATMLAPQHSFAWSSKSRVLNYLKQYEEALAASEEAIRLNPQNAIGWSYRGVALMDGLMRYEEALIAFDRAIMLDPTYALAWNNRGSDLSDLKRYEEALIACDRAIALDSSLAIAWNNRGNALSGLKRYEEALTAYERAITLDSSYTLAWNNKSIALRALGRAAEVQSAEAKAKEPGYF